VIDKFRRRRWTRRLAVEPAEKAVSAPLSPLSFSLTFDYLCPFARNAVEGVKRGLEEGRDWDPCFIPFSLSQVHVEPSDVDVWDRDLHDVLPSGVRALAWGIAVRDLYPAKFLDYHLLSFAARHDEAADINDPIVLAKIAKEAGLDDSKIATEVESGEPLKTLAVEHADAVQRWSVFGVPTFIVGEAAAFARLMERGQSDDVAQVLEMLSWKRLNEFKRTRLPR